MSGWHRADAAQRDRDDVRGLVLAAAANNRTSVRSARPTGFERVDLIKYSEPTRRRSLSTLTAISGADRAIGGGDTEDRDGSSRPEPNANDHGARREHLFEQSAARAGHLRQRARAMRDLDAPIRRGPMQIWAFPRRDLLNPLPVLALRSRRSFGFGAERRIKRSPGLDPGPRFYWSVDLV
jgi:hypothetical protein